MKRTLSVIELEKIDAYFRAANYLAAAELYLKNNPLLKEPLKFIGNIVLVVKILIPIIIIAFGMIDFFRAIIGSKDDEIKKSTRSLIFRIIAGVVIFLLPTLVSFIFSLIDSWANIEGEFNACQKCVLNVRECK